MGKGVPQAWAAALNRASIMWWEFFPYSHRRCRVMPALAAKARKNSSVMQVFFRAFATNAGITLHLKCEYGKNSHHMIEALFKAAAHALRDAAARRRGMCCFPPRECCKALDGPAGVCYNKKNCCEVQG